MDDDDDGKIVKRYTEKERSLNRHFILPYDSAYGQCSYDILANSHATTAHLESKSTAWH